MIGQTCRGRCCTWASCTSGSVDTTRQRPPCFDPSPWRRSSTPKPRVPAVRDMLATECDELANVVGDRGRSAEALALLRRADTLAEALATDFPSVVEYQNSRAAIHRDLANFLDDRGLLADAESAFTRAIALGRALVEAQPDVPLYRRSLAIHHNNLASLHRALTRIADAQREHQSALALAEELVADHRETLDYQVLLGHFLRSYAMFLRATGRFAEAEPVFRRVLEHLEALAKQYPEVPEIRSLLTSALSQAGDLLLILKRPAKAERALQHGAELGEQLTAGFPSIPAFAYDTALNFQGLAQLVLDRKQPARAREFQEQALRYTRRALELNPQNRRFRAMLARGFGLIAELQLRAGDESAAEESLRTLESSAELPMDIYNFACYLSRCLGAVPESPWPAAKRAAVARAFGDRAIAALRRAVDRGYRNIDLIRTDPDLDPLRSRPDFQLLLLDLNFPADPFAR